MNAVYDGNDEDETYERPADERCRSCRFFDWVDTHEGYCRRLAPEPRLYEKDDEPMEVPEVIWPKVFDTDWCGEWQRATPADVSRGTDTA